MHGPDKEYFFTGLIKALNETDTIHVNLSMYNAFMFGGLVRHIQEDFTNIKNIKVMDPYRGTFRDPRFFYNKKFDYVTEDHFDTGKKDINIIYNFDWDTMYCRGFMPEQLFKENIEYIKSLFWTEINDSDIYANMWLSLNQYYPNFTKDEFYTIIKENLKVI